MPGGFELPYIPTDTLQKSASQILANTRNSEHVGNNSYIHINLYVRAGGDRIIPHILDALEQEHGKIKSWQVCIVANTVHGLWVKYEKDYTNIQSQ